MTSLFVYIINIIHDIFSNILIQHDGYRFYKEENVHYQERQVKKTSPFFKFIAAPVTDT